MSTLSKSRTAVWAAGFLVSAMILLAAACSTNTSAANAPEPPEVGVVRASRRTFRFTANGSALWTGW